MSFHVVTELFYARAHDFLRKTYLRIIVLLRCVLAKWNDRRGENVSITSQKKRSALRNEIIKRV
jgi:hypothetical protein